MSPSVQAFAEAESDARMVLKVLRMFRDAVSVEILGRPNYGETQLFGHPNRNHVTLNEFAKLYTRIHTPLQKDRQDHWRT